MKNVNFATIIIGDFLSKSCFDWGHVLVSPSPMNEAAQMAFNDLQSKLHTAEGLPLEIRYILQQPLATNM